MRFKELSESTVAGSIASVAMPLGGTQKRNKPEKAPKVTKGKRYANTLSEGEIKRIATDMDELSDAAFKKKYRKTKQEMRASLKEEKIAEADLIVVPGMRKSKDKSFIPHKEDRRDHEVEMARSELHAAAKDAMRIFKLLKDRSEDDGIMGWQQSYITLASDYLNSVADSLEYQMNMYEMTGGVIAGGMSNFEEGRYYNPLDQERREQDAMDQERRDFKRREMEYELRGEEEAARRANEGPWYIRIDGKLVRDKNKDPYVFNTLEAARKAAQTMMKKDWNKGKQFTMTRSITEGMSAAVKLQRAFDREKSKSDASRERGKEELEKARKEYDKKQGKCPECGGEMVSEELMNEKKDACYYKVKSRYKVWPSAYASGALVKCRKKGASNWGNKSKK